MNTKRKFKYKQRDKSIKHRGSSGTKQFLINYGNRKLRQKVRRLIKKGEYHLPDKEKMYQYANSYMWD